MNWHLGDDVVALGPLRVAVQRIGLSHWRASGRLRSWGLAPLHREADAVLVPCTDAEALWLGAWMEDEDVPASARVRDPQTNQSGALELPRDYQLTALVSAGTPAEPLTLPPGDAGRTLLLDVLAGPASASLRLTLLPPAAWAARSGRAPPPPLGAPPPLPPRLG